VRPAQDRRLLPSSIHRFIREEGACSIDAFMHQGPWPGPVELSLPNLSGTALFSEVCSSTWLDGIWPAALPEPRDGESLKAGSAARLCPAGCSCSSWTCAHLYLVRRQAGRQAATAPLRILLPGAEPLVGTAGQATVPHRKAKAVRFTGLGLCYAR